MSLIINSTLSYLRDLSRFLEHKLNPCNFAFQLLIFIELKPVFFLQTRHLFGLVDLAELSFTININNLVMDSLILDAYSLMHVRNLFQVLFPHRRSILLVKLEVKSSTSGYFLIGLTSARQP